ncbi:unnamed protein product [Notodromas monacha]|uniref:Iron-sulfur cluster assembly 1 homolog, mitochondrial n=1 Tax=Notodromas monacha TaxID=399045 RepID=A0A7R9BV21_9CRUS|nr:unnamed protein product [Notodromas monacha]CAG0921236.1 unnamed protein product [Notodromas monacha]
MASMARPIGTATVRALKGRKLIPTRAALVLTKAAVDRVKELTREEPGVLGLRIGVKQRGCNGLSYTLEFAKEKAKLDEVVQQDGVTVLIDKKAQLSLLGTEMDYVSTTLSSEFVFNNPNIQGTCGCGESFNL